MRRPPPPPTPLPHGRADAPHPLKEKSGAAKPPVPRSPPPRLGRSAWPPEARPSLPHEPSRPTSFPLHAFRVRPPFWAPPGSSGDTRLSEAYSALDKLEKASV